MTEAGTLTVDEKPVRFEVTARAACKKVSEDPAPVVWGSTADLAARMSLKAREGAERAGAIGTVHADAAHGTDIGVRRPSYIIERLQRGH